MSLVSCKLKYFFHLIISTLKMLLFKILGRFCIKPFFKNFGHFDFENVTLQNILVDIMLKTEKFEFSLLFLPWVCYRQHMYLFLSLVKV